MKKILLCAVFIAASFTSIAQVGIGTANPDASAALEIESTTKGLLLPRMMLGQINAITTPAEGLMVYCLDCKTKGYFVNNGTEFINIRNGNGLITITTVVDITTTTGKTWMDRNLGATQVATSSTDAASYGDLYQWGRDSDGHQIRTSNVISTIATSAAAGHDDFIDAGIDHWVEGGSVGEVPDGNWTNFSEEDTLWQSGLNDPCPKGFRIPTEAEWQDEINTWTNTNKAQAAMNSELNLPLAGYRYGSSGTLYSVGSIATYMSRTLNGQQGYARLLYWFSNTEVGMFDSVREVGRSVRCIQE